MWFVNRPWSPAKGCHIQGVPGTDTAETDGLGRGPWLEGMQGGTLKDMKPLSPSQSPPGSHRDGGLPTTPRTISSVPASAPRPPPWDSPRGKSIWGSRGSVLDARLHRAWYDHSSPASGAMVRKGRENLKNPVSTTRVTTEGEKTPSVREAAGQARC